jgi:hypothetical protein
MIYLASPYSHKNSVVMDVRFDKVVAVAAQLINRGYIIYSPIMHFHPIAVRHELPRDFAFWKEVNTQILKRCDKLWVLELDGWRESRGVQAEILFARELNIEVSHIMPQAWGVAR